MIKLHLGCGKRNFGSEWIHIDGGSFEHLDSNNILKLDFEDNSVDIIYASHVLEYFDREEAWLVLKEWYWVLVPGGILRLAVPNFEAMANLYVENKCNLQQIIGPMYGRMKMDDSYIYHKTVYDKSSLSELLLSAGFKNIRKLKKIYCKKRKILVNQLRNVKFYNKK